MSINTFSAEVIGLFNKVGSSLARLISPISTAAPGPSGQGNPHKKEQNQASQSGSKGNGGQEKEGPERHPESQNNVVHLDERRRLGGETGALENGQTVEPPPLHIQSPLPALSVSSSFLVLLERLKAQRGTLSRWLGRRTYSTTKGGKKSIQYRKGSMMDDKAE